MSVLQQTRTFHEERPNRVSAAPGVPVRIGSAERGEHHEDQNDQIRSFWRRSSTYPFQNIVFSTPQELALLLTASL
jgi:hypothetical protein